MEIGREMKYEGLDYEGPPLDFKNDDPSEGLPKFSYRPHVDQFNLNDPEDVARYEEANGKMNRGEGTLSYEDRVYDADVKSWRVLVVWTEFYYGAPENLEGVRVEKPPEPDDGEIKTSTEMKDAK